MTREEPAWWFWINNSNRWITVDGNVRSWCWPLISLIVIFIFFTLFFFFIKLGFKCTLTIRNDVFKSWCFSSREQKCDPLHFQLNLVPWSIQYFLKVVKKFYYFLNDIADDYCEFGDWLISFIFSYYSLWNISFNFSKCWTIFVGRNSKICLRTLLSKNVDLNMIANNFKTNFFA